MYSPPGAPTGKAAAWGCGVAKTAAVAVGVDRTGGFGGACHNERVSRSLSAGYADGPQRPGRVWCVQHHRQGAADLLPRTDMASHSMPQPSLFFAVLIELLRTSFSVFGCREPTRTWGFCLPGNRPDVDGHPPDGNSHLECVRRSGAQPRSCRVRRPTVAVLWVAISAAALLEPTIGPRPPRRRTGVAGSSR